MRHQPQSFSASEVWLLVVLAPGSRPVVCLLSGGGRVVVPGVPGCAPAPTAPGFASFQLFTGPLFVEKVVDVVGLYHNPPERAVVLCVDEKSSAATSRSASPGGKIRGSVRGSMKVTTGSRHA
jgi:hypothetical protein